MGYDTHTINPRNTIMLFETDVPIPPPYHGGHTKTAYPFSRLAPGQSVLWPCTDKKARHLARKAAYQVASRLNWQITVRSLPDGVRVWRHN